MARWSSAGRAFPDTCRASLDLRVPRPSETSTLQYLDPRKFSSRLTPGVSITLMPPRAITSGVISFGLVSIPVKLYTAASSEQARFNMLDSRNGVRVKQQYISPADGKVMDKAEIIKGYEYARDQYVTFTDEELKALE